MKKYLYWIVFGLSAAIVLFYAVVSILKSYTDLSMKSWIFDSPQTRLIVASLVTIVIIMLKGTLTRRR